MQESLAKILSFVAFIVLGYILRRTGVLKAETFHAVSGLVIYVTLPCVIAANLNGIRIEGTMLLIALFGFAANILLLTYAWILTLRTKDRDMRDFIRLNANKINDYIEILRVYGTQAGEPYIKHLDGEIWELRPLRNRILFVVSVAFRWGPLPSPTFRPFIRRRGCSQRAFLTSETSL